MAVVRVPVSAARLAPVRVTVGGSEWMRSGLTYKRSVRRGDWWAGRHRCAVRVPVLRVPMPRARLSTVRVFCHDKELCGACILRACLVHVNESGPLSCDRIF